MYSTFSGLEIGRRAMGTHQTALDVTGHNLANQSNPAYSRQEANIATMSPLTVPSLARAETAGQVGQGSLVDSITRIRDTFIDDRIFEQQKLVGYYETKHFYLERVQAVQGEPFGQSIQTAMDSFSNAWNDLANDPTNLGAREVLRDQGIQLTNRINEQFEQFKSLQRDTNDRIADVVSRINSAAVEIADLSRRIANSKNVGDHPNDLMDRRDAVVENLARMVDIRVERGGNDEFITYIGSQHLTQGGLANQLDLKINRDTGNPDVYWGNTGKPVYTAGGELHALMETRDRDLAFQIESLNTIAASLISGVNDVHKQGFGLNYQTGVSFFHENVIAQAAQNLQAGILRPDARGNADINGDGLVDSTLLHRVSGTESMTMDTTLNISGSLNLGNGKLVAYYETDSVRDVVDRINAADAGMVAYLNSDGNLTLKALASSATGPIEQPQVRDYGFVTRETFADLGAALGQSGILRVGDVDVPYQAQDNVQALIDRVNRLGAPLQATLNAAGQLDFVATPDLVDGNQVVLGAVARPDFALSRLQDSGSFLTDFSGILRESGVAGAFDFRQANAADQLRTTDRNIAVTPFQDPAQWIRLSDQILASAQNIAAGRGADLDGDGRNDAPNGVGDGSNALQIMATLVSSAERREILGYDSVDTNPIMVSGTHRDFSDFLAFVTNKTGLDGKSAKDNAEHQNEILGSLVDKRAEISGVNIDEEVSKMIMYQHGYVAGARVVSVVNRMIETILNLV